MVFDVKLRFRPHFRIRHRRDEYGNPITERGLRDAVEEWCQGNCHGSWTVVPIGWVLLHKDYVKFRSKPTDGLCDYVVTSYCLRFTDPRDAVLFKVFWC